MPTTSWEMSEVCSRLILLETLPKRWLISGGRFVSSCDDHLTSCFECHWVEIGDKCQQHKVNNQIISSLLCNGSSRRDWRLVEGYPEQSLHPVWWYRDIDVEEEVNEDTGVYTAEITADENEDLWTGYFIQVYTG